jgi:hypothetical protein
LRCVPLKVCPAKPTSYVGRSSHVSIHLHGHEWWTANPPDFSMNITASWVNPD